MGLLVLAQYDLTFGSACATLCVQISASGLNYRPKSIPHCSFLLRGYCGVIMKKIQKSKRTKVQRITRKLKAILGSEISLKPALKFTHKHIMIRPRLRLASKAIIIGTIALVPLSYASQTIAQNRDKVVINGHKILVAEAAFNNTDETGDLDQAIEAKKSPFEFHMPVDGYISQGFSRYHSAVDIASDFGKPIHTLGAGTVVFAGFMADGHGNTVVVEHDNGLASLYAHMGKIYVGVGNQIDTQRPIGTVGLTGRTTGPHVHVEIIDNGIYVDPAGLLPVN